MELLDISSLVPSAVDRLVAVEPADGGQAILFRRREDGELEQSTVPFHPWLLVSGPELAAALEGSCEIQPLNGNGIHRARVFFPDISSYETAIRQLKQLTGAGPGSPLAPYRIFSDLTQQILFQLPARLFRGMRFNDIRRMQLDIETRTTEGFFFPNADRPGDEVILVSLRDSTGWETCLSAHETGEAELLRTMIRLIQERDPDVIEGHNIFNFDLDYLEKRCRRHKIPFRIGRNGHLAKARASRFSAAERITAYRRFDLYGRHVIDTYHLTQLYDISHRDMESHGLKAVARYFNVAAPDRTYVDGEAITQIYDSNPETLAKYCLDDVRETDAISRILSPSFFHQAQLIPLSYQNCVCRGTATRIDGMLCAEYLLAGESLPQPQRAQPFQGALTEAEAFGVFHDVWHIDVRSLYPSIIISRQLCPVGDRLKVFLRLLTGLRRFRLAAKDAMKQATPETREYYSALQSSFKILINSFYGYVGFEQGTFNDYELANAITSAGRTILSGMRDFLVSQQAVIIEMDTDGIYFHPHDPTVGQAEMERRVQATLPEGIEIELDAVYAAMYGYKSKNYALMDENGRVTMSGAALKSRGIEPFQRRYIKEHITLLLQGRNDALPALYQKYEEDIREHRLPLKDFAKREILSMSPDAYKSKLANGETKRSAAYELALASNYPFAQGDSVEFYVTGTKKTVSVTGNSKLLKDADPAMRDENTAYYLDKLAQLKAKFT